ncbi:MAG TPA: cytochrome C oxidase subunit IV family protein [Thermoplasmata archaeon]|jgi:caa(3)-type oxidase subunit IV|nr:cytochrome C oxidase subunit IV family protein [Thermoplasmata archaeon]
MEATAEAAHGRTLVEEVKRPYVLVLVLLAVVTILEVQVPSLGSRFSIPESLQILLLMVSSVSKAVLVALYYMHLRYEARIMRLIPVGPLVFVALLVIAVTLGG